MKKMLLLSLAVLLAGTLLVSSAVYKDFLGFLDSPLNVAEEDELAFTVAPGASIATIARELEDRAVLRSALYWQVHARLSGLAARIKAGEYAITHETTPRSLLENLVAGRVIQYSLTIVEGWTFRQMLEAVHNHDKLEHTLRDLGDAEIMEHLGRPGEHPEGRFFPDTYYFPRGTTDLAFLKRAYETMEKRLQDAWEARAPGLPLQSPYEALILASIIEKETGQPSEREEIAGVFVRRLQKGMLLQTDPTVIYGVGDSFDGNLQRKHLETDTPYNTYTRKGLPPSPIALPGAHSLVAAVNPALGDSLYFVAKGDGSHVFSSTINEHNRAVRKYQLNGR